MWLEASLGCHPHVEVLNTAVDVSNVFWEQLDEEQHVWVMSVLVRVVNDSTPSVYPGDILCCLRPMDDDCHQALETFRVASLVRNESSVSVLGPERSVSVLEPEGSVLVL